jgi:hypothetical protein
LGLHRSTFSSPTSGSDWFFFKIYHAKSLANYDFGYYMVYYQNLSNSHIWLYQICGNFLPNFWLAKPYSGKFWKRTYWTLNFASQTGIAPLGLSPKKGKVCEAPKEAHKNF